MQQAASTVAWADPADITYGTPLGAAKLSATASVPGTFVYTPGAGTVLDAGDNQVLSMIFTPTDTADYTTASATAHINVDQATPTITWANPADITYGTILGATQLDATASVAGTFAYTPAAGTLPMPGSNKVLAVTFTPTDNTDYTTATATAHINVARATPTVTWANPADIIYGTALSATQLDATSSLPGTFTYAPAAGTVLSAGSNQTLTATFTPTDSTDYNLAAGSAAYQRGQGNPDGHLGQPSRHHLRRGAVATQLDATASQPGTFTYTPSAGTVLSADDDQLLSVTFISTDTADENPTTVEASINVLKAIPTVTWANPAGITYGTVLGATQLDASASVPEPSPTRRRRAASSRRAPERPSRPSSRPPTWSTTAP